MCVKLLIADDEDMIRNGIAKYIKLHTDRYETIYLAKNGQEALDIIYPVSYTHLTLPTTERV